MDDTELKTSNFIDIHCHFDEVERKELAKLKQNNIVALTACTDFTSYQRCEELRQANVENLYFAYGVHPDVVASKSKTEIFLELEKMNFENCIAIGEIGLDYKVATSEEQKLLQKELFEKQLELAEKLNKPAIIHSRDSRKEVLDMLDSFQVKAILHWFTANEPEIKRAFDSKHYLSIRYNRPNLQNLPQELLTKIFIETDYPIPISKIPNDILNIKKSYEIFSEEHKIDLELLKIKVQENFIKLFSR